MTAPPTTSPANARERVVAFLAFLTSDACRAACRPFIAAEALAFELCRLWLDAIYLPSERYMDGLKGDQSTEALEQFMACFSGDERAALERFHRFLDLRLRMLPPEARRRRIFPQNDAWRNLVKDAGYLLDDLAADPAAVQQHLAGLVHALIHQASPDMLPDAFPLGKLLTSQTGPAPRP